MTTQSLILFLVIGCLAGFLAGKIMKGSGSDWLGTWLSVFSAPSSAGGCSASSASPREELSAP